MTSAGVLFQRIMSNSMLFYASGSASNPTVSTLFWSYPGVSTLGVYLIFAHMVMHVRASTQQFLAKFGTGDFVQGV